MADGDVPMKRKQNKHERQAFMYLRGGSLLGGHPVEALVKRAADAIDPSVTDGLRGLGVAIPDIAQAIKLLSEAYACANAALAVMQEQEGARTRSRVRKKNSRA